MAYNREWDQGKDNWQGDGGGYSGDWYPGNDNGGRRGRDDDYGGSDPKRRKFNEGGYDSTQGYDSGSYNAGYYAQQGQGQSQAVAGGAYGTGPGAAGAPYFGKKKMVPSEPSCHVIFLGLDTEFTEADLHAYLTQHGCAIETITIIRERSTGLSKGFGFAQFSTIESARKFVDPSFPFIQVPPPASHGATAAAQFWKALETGAPHSGRRVKIDYSQSANPNEKKRPGQGNDGTRDIGNSPAPVLLFRGLDPLSGPQAILQAMKTSSGLHKEGAKGMKRIILIKDKTTLASWGFTFVEFVDTQSASAVLAATMSPQIHPNGFRISDKPVAASFAHAYSFQPIENQMMRDDASMQSSMALGGVEGVWVRYWDEGTTAAILEFQVEEPAQAAAPTKEKKKKQKAPDADLISLAPPEASTLPVSDKPVTLSFKTSLAAKKGPVAPAKAGVFANDDGGDDGGESDEEKMVAENAKVAAAKRVAPMIASKKIASNITKWNQAQEVVSSGSSALPPQPVAASSSNVVQPVQAVVPKKIQLEPSVPPEAEFEFSDMVKLTCLLCARQFKTVDQLGRHNKESDLHKRNYKDANLRDVARKKALAVKEKSSDGGSSTPDAQQPKYRDRASERRVMHNQPEVPLPEGVEERRKPRRFADGPPPPPSPPPPVLNPGEDESNVGNKLLKMMGWKEGTGLGLEGEGRVDPIQTALYASGAGLGASKGKEVGKYQDGYAGYVSMAKDAARERYDA